jgi:hypothetical protein
MKNNQNKSDLETVHCYAKRRLNPFRGVMEVIESEDGRALSCNGVVWEILVRATQGCASGNLTDNDKKTFYRFGMWSKDYGLMKRSDSPVDDQDYFDLSSKCDVLVGYLEEYHDQLPFPLEDNLELWLFDKDDHLPIALLSSMLPDSSLPSLDPKLWSACKGPTGNASQHRYPHAEELEMQVNQRSGNSMHTHWLRRLTGGEGVIEGTDDSIPAEQFPVLLLDENWNDEREQQCAHEYIRWISPSLLTLQHLDRVTRERIENNLNVQAISIEHHWHLYPEIIDQKLLKAARVQSRIQGCR